MYIHILYKIRAHKKRSGDVGLVNVCHAMNDEIQCRTLIFFATYCIILQHTATHCNTLQHTAAQCNVSLPRHVHWNALKCIATHCTAPQHLAPHCNASLSRHVHCNTLQHTATHCNTLQRIVATPHVLFLRMYPSN